MTVSTEKELTGDPDSADSAARSGAFQVPLAVFEGPFDLLLALISKHKLDITEVALSQVTDEFIAYISQRSDGWELDQVSYFLVVAATLLAPRLRQSPPTKEAAPISAARMTAPPRRFPRRVPLEPRFAELLPEVLLGLGPAEFARLAALTLAPKPPPKVSTEHIHSPVISIKDQVRIVAALLKRLGRASFRRLTADAQGSYEVVASFLALLELYREDAVSFEQVTPLGELYVTWTGSVDPDRVGLNGASPNGAGPNGASPNGVGSNRAGTGSVSELTESDNEE